MAIVFKRTKILATVGPDTSTPEMLEKLIAAGVNGIRLNFSHGTYEEREEQIPWIREQVSGSVSLWQFFKTFKVQKFALVC